MSQAFRIVERAGYDDRLTMDQPDKHAHHHPHDHGGSAAVREPSPSWLLHSVAQRLLGVVLIGALLVAAMLWATSRQG